MASLPGSDLVALGTNRGLVTLVDLETGSFQDYLGCVNTFTIKAIHNFGQNYLVASDEYGGMVVFKTI